MRAKADAAAPENLVHTLFVYGSLLSGEPNHGVLRGATLIGPAETEPAFELVHWHAHPALVLGGHTAVKGELYEVSSELLAEIDEFEEHPDHYQRTTLCVSNRDVEAYLVSPDRLVGLPRIASGDWRSRIR